MRRRSFLAASAAALSLPSVAKSASTRVLKFIPQADLAILDPIWTTAYTTLNHSYMVFDTLYGQTGYQDGFRPKPQMLAGHTTEDDGKTWKLTLREGLVFHDGEKVLARDCVASIKRWGVRDSFGQALMARTDELSAPDDRTIVFRLKQPFALLPDALGHGGPNTCAIMPQRLAETDPFKQVTEMVGSGPFRFKADERVHGSLSVYERFDKYRPRDDGEPSFTAGPKIVHFDRVEWHVLPDTGTMAAAMQASLTRLGPPTYPWTCWRSHQPCGGPSGGTANREESGLAHNDGHAVSSCNGSSRRGDSDGEAGRSSADDLP